MFCTGFSQQFSSSIAPAYLYYCSIPVAAISLILGFLIFRFGDKKRSSKILFSLTIASFFLFFSNFILWIAVGANIQTFVWFLNQFDFLLLPLLSFFLFSEFIKKNETPSNFLETLILILVAIFIPIVLLGYNINYFDLYNCTVVETNWIVIYQNAVLILSCLLMIYMAIKNVFSTTETRESKTRIVLLAAGLCAMLFSLFFTWNPLIFGYPDGVDQFGFIGVIIFLSIITYMVVKFRMFGMKLLATQALVFALTALIGSQFFFIKVFVNFILTGITFVASIVLGYFLIKSVKKEIEQKEQLKVLLQQRESLTHLVTHKVKGAFTRSKFIFAEMLNGTFGEISATIKDVARKGLISDNQGISTVDLVLNAANLQSGTVRYEMKELDFKTLVTENFDDLKGVAEEKGLKIALDMKEDDYKMLGDVFWLKEVVHNLIDNSIRYTPKGSVDISLTKKDKKILFTVKDTGVGITEEDKKNLFKEGGRGVNSVKVNVDSTGYGLYTVKMIVDEHKGRIWAESEGQDKGTTFHLELNGA